MQINKVTTTSFFNFIGATLSCIIWLPFSIILFLIWEVTGIDKLRIFNDNVGNWIFKTFDLEIVDKK